MLSLQVSVVAFR